jgi:hypothetical protein
MVTIPVAATTAPAPVPHTIDNITTSSASEQIGYQHPAPSKIII